MIAALRRAGAAMVLEALGHGEGPAASVVPDAMAQLLVEDEVSPEVPCKGARRGKPTLPRSNAGQAAGARAGGQESAL
eukprot:11728262-Alexandrium_andersonii.AAC.1